MSSETDWAPGLERSPLQIERWHVSMKIISRPKLMKVSNAKVRLKCWIKKSRDSRQV